MSRQDHTRLITPHSIPHLLTNVWRNHGFDGYAFIGWKDNRGWKQKAIQCDDLSGIDALITKHSDCDLYFCPNVSSKPHRRRSCALPSVWGWCDIDHDYILRFPIAPNVQWETSPRRCQALWLWDKRHSVNEAEAYSRALAKFSVDGSGWEITKMLRIPGTLNYKRSRPFRVGLVHHDDWMEQSERPELIAERKRPSDTGDIDRATLDGRRLSIKYRVAIPMKAEPMMGDDGHPDRSATIMWLAGLMRNAGASDEEIAAMLPHSKAFRMKYGDVVDDRAWAEIERVCSKLEKKMTRTKAIERESKTYHGKVCERHPELEGLRRTKSRLCVACKRAYNQARTKTEAYKEWRREWLRKQKATDVASASG